MSDNKLIETLTSSESVEWYTPKQYTDAARIVLGGTIYLDPASCALANKQVKAQHYYTQKDDGLTLPWDAPTVFCNPPYGYRGPGKFEGGSNQAHWSAKMIKEYDRYGFEAIFLCNAQTGEKWFRPLWNHLICFTDHRIKFDTPNGASTGPLKGSAFVYFGSQECLFADTFAKFGEVVERFKR